MAGKLKDAMVCLVMVVMVLLVMEGVSAGLHTIGKDMRGWQPGINYTEWAMHEHFYIRDWLRFYFDRQYYKVLEVNRKGYDFCCYDQSCLIDDWSRGAGRDHVQVNESKDYYFISSGGYCYHGMKLAIHVEEPPPASAPLPNNDLSSSPFGSYANNLLPTPSHRIDMVVPYLFTGLVLVCLVI